MFEDILNKEVIIYIKPDIKIAGTICKLNSKFVEVKSSGVNNIIRIFNPEDNIILINILNQNKQQFQLKEIPEVKQTENKIKEILKKPLNSNSGASLAALQKQKAELEKQQIKESYHKLYKQPSNEEQSQRYGYPSVPNYDTKQKASGENEAKLRKLRDLQGRT